MIKVLDFLGRKAPLFLALGFFLGLILPKVQYAFDVVTTPLLILLLITSMVRVNFQELITHLRSPLKLIVIVCFLMFVLPMGIGSFAQYLSLPPPLFLALLLVLCAPPLSSSPGLIALLKLDTDMALSVMVSATLLSPFSAPFVLSFISDQFVSIDAIDLFIRLFLVVFISMVLTIVIRKLLGKERIRTAVNVIDGCSALLMVLFAFLILNQFELYKLTDISLVFQTGLMALSVNWGMHAIILFSACLVYLMYGVFSENKLKQTGAIAIMAGNRNMALFIVILPPEYVVQILFFMT
ncbi:MAG: hypothetical protein HWE34_16780, partial [Methylocystaceae bacterium]|nr:hypothetical protein [Methylocystaceae bacterium]